ncbi:hypothetical protein BC940DRAFT_22228 [Gongronella butleri]|nr:hypothetical protein BC940DRAFT_22228 [Gongronella butleri]
MNKRVGTHHTFFFFFLSFIFFFSLFILPPPHLPPLNALLNAQPLFIVFFSVLCKIK